MYNTMFCHPGTKVIDIQSEDHWIYSYTGMYASLELNYGIFVEDPIRRTLARCIADGSSISTR